MAVETYYQKRKKKFKRVVVDVPMALYRAFRQSDARKRNVTDSAGLREILRTTLEKTG